MCGLLFFLGGALFCFLVVGGVDGVVGGLMFLLVAGAGWWGMRLGNGGGPGDLHGGDGGGD